MPKSTRYEAAQKLEAKGMLLRSQEGWELTRSGLHHAVAQGIMPTPKPYFSNLPDVIPSEDAPVIPRFSPKVDKFFWFKYWLRWVLLGIWLHIVVVLIMHYTGFANIW